MRATLYPELAEKIEGLGRRGQVLAGIWAGRGTKEIAADLGLSPKTVEYHRARLYRVFGVNDLVSLCRRAIAVGLIKPKSGVPNEGCPRHCLTHAIQNQNQNQNQNQIRDRYKKGIKKKGTEV